MFIVAPLRMNLLLSSMGKTVPVQTIILRVDLKSRYVRTKISQVSVLQSSETLIQSACTFFFDRFSPCVLLLTMIFLYAINGKETGAVVQRVQYR